MIGWKLALLFPVWLTVIAFLRAYRVWLFYYMLGAAGCAYWLAMIIHAIPSAELLFTGSVALGAHLASGPVGLPTRMFEGAPGTLLVLVVGQDAGWTVLQVGIESSGLLEMSVLCGLLAFYPGWSVGRRARAIGLGLLATWAGNVLRMIIVVASLHWLGKSGLILAHAIIGKVFFFWITIAIYWYLMTSPTLEDVGSLLRQRRFAH
jgi:exosortase family protein XrtG